MTNRIPEHPLPAARLSALCACLALALPLAAMALPIQVALPPASAPAAPSQPDSLILAQQGCGSDCGGPPLGGTPTVGGGSTPTNTGISTTQTGKIVRSLATVSKTCSPEFVERRYRIDCLRWALRQIAQDLPQTGDYAPVREALAKASRDLGAIVQTYADPNAPQIRPSLGGKPLAAQLPPISAVRAQDQDRALRAAEQVLDEAVTVLLRSAENSQRRKIPYQEIAAALGSTKVLLRSA